MTDDLLETSVVDEEEKKEEESNPFTEESLKGNDLFLNDASTFLQERTGESYEDPDEIMANFLEQMRIGTVNEVSMLRDLEYAKKANQEGKKRFARLIDVYEKMDTDFGLAAVGDYAQGVLTAPSTAIGVFTGGAGKVASQTAVTAGRQSLKTMLKEGVKKFATTPGVKMGAARAAAVEAPIAAFGEDIRQRTRENVGMERQEGAVAGAAAGGAIGGAVFGGIGGYFGKKAATQADELSRVAQRAVEEKKVAQKAVNAAQKEKLRKLDPELVKAGDELLEEMNQNERLSARLSPETMESIAVMTSRLSAKLDREPGERVTMAVARGLNDGKISKQEFQKILDEHKLTASQFTNAYLSTVSGAAKTLQQQAQLKKMFTGLSERGILDATDEEILEAAAKPRKVYEFVQNLDRLRLAAMTSQLATTMRNNIGGGFRLAVDVMDNSFLALADTVTGKRKAGDAFRDVLTTGKYFLNQKEARVIQEMMSEEMPMEAQRMFFSAAQAEVRSGSNSRMAKVGHALNIFNTWSDHYFKRAMFASSLDRRLRKDTGRSLNDYIRAGDFNMIEKDQIHHAVDESLHFVYQKSPESKAGKALIQAHRDLPFVVSGLLQMPFPRFLMNQFKFLSDHSVGLGVITGRKFGVGEKLTNEEWAKKATGVTMLTTATMFQASKDPDLKWNQVEDSQGNVVDMSPVYGPLSPYMIMGDFVNKYYNGMPLGKLKGYMMDTLKALGTPRYRPGQFEQFSLMVEDASEDKANRMMGRFLGDVVGTYFIPAATIKDIASVYEGKEATYIEDQNIVLGSRADTPVIGDGLDILEYAVHYASKNFPRVKLEGEYDMSYIVPEGKRRYSPTQGKMERAGQIEKQLFGTAKYSRRSEFQKELDRLRMDRRELFKPDPDPIRDSIKNYVIGNLMPEKMNSYIQTEKYQSLPWQQKEQYLKNAVKYVMEKEDVSGLVDGFMETVYIDDGTVGHPRIQSGKYPYIFRESFEKLPKTLRKAVNAQHKKEFDGLGVRETGNYIWAVDAAKAMEKDL